MESNETELAASRPEPATAGTPIPGKQESPQTSKFFMGVPGNGNDPSPALIAGPYEPSYLRRNRRCVNGVPTWTTFARARISGMTFSRTFHRYSLRSSFSALYSVELPSTAEQHCLPPRLLYSSHLCTYNVLLTASVLPWWHEIQYACA